LSLLGKIDLRVEGIADFHALLVVVNQQAKRIKELEKRVHERQLGQNANNSSKPPSSDGLRKPTNLRTPGSKKGAPKGHAGTKLQFVDEHNEIVVHALRASSGCLSSLDAVESQTYDKRQVFDLSPRIWVTKHRAEKKFCPKYGLQKKASFPARIHAPPNTEKAIRLGPLI
jgi:transposase